MENGKTGILYVVQNTWITNPETRETPYKIGITQNSVEKRYRGLGLKMPGVFNCKFAYEFDENRYKKVEEIMHSLFDASRINGEWFCLNDKQLYGIKEACLQFGGKLRTEETEEEIEKATGEEDFDTQLANSDKNIQSLFEKINACALSFGNDVSVKRRKFYAAFQKKNIFMQLRVRRNFIILRFLGLKDVESENDSFTRDISCLTNWGTHEVTIKNDKDFEEAKPLIERAYTEN